MTWIDRLIDCVPDSPQRVGAWMFTYGAIGTAAAFYLHDVPLAVQSLLLWSGGAIGSALADLKRRKKARFTPMSQAEEDAAVEAAIRGMEAEEHARSQRVRLMASGESSSPQRHSLH